MKLKIFDVVELNDNNRATILNINNKEYLAEIVNSAGISLGNRIITYNDINVEMKWEVFSAYTIPVTDDYLQTNFNNQEEFFNFINLILISF